MNIGKITNIYVGSVRKEFITNANEVKRQDDFMFLKLSRNLDRI